ncbi:uncharacterized protein LJ206_015345 isoform 2-T2 [Theristicus caerulescens]
MERSEPPPGPGPGSPGCPDLLRHVGGPFPSLSSLSFLSPLSPLYRSFFEAECRAIASRLSLAAAAAEPSPGPAEGSALWPDAAGPATSTPATSTPLQHSPPFDEGAPGGAAPAARPSTAGCEAAAAPGPAREQPRRLPQPAAGCPGSRLARPRALSRAAARRGAGQPPCGGPGPAGRPRTPGRSPGRGGGRAALSRPRASLRLERPKGGKGLGAPGTRLPQPAAAVKVGSHRQPSQRLSTAIPILASRSRLRLLGKVPSPKRFCLGSTTQELVCNTTQELKENAKADQTWVCVGPSFSGELAPGPTSGCGNAVPADQSAGDQLFQELKHAKNELERVKGKLAEKTVQCEAYRQMISSLQAQLRAAGICPVDAAVEESGDLGRD